MLDRLYELLLRLLPRDYDGGDRHEMLEHFRGRAASAAERGGIGAARRERLHELADLFRTVFRARNPLPSFDSLRQDVRFGVRSLLRSPIASLLAVTSLALGLGATTALFSVLDVWLVRPLPFPNADRLVAVGMANRERGWNFNALSVRDYADWVREAESVELAVYAPGSFNLTAGDRVERIRALSVSANLLDVLGLQPARGRGFTAEDGRPDAARVAVVSDSFWRFGLGADPAAVGRPITLDGVPFTVVGVLRPNDGIPGMSADVWRPMRIAGTEPRSGHSLWGVGLLPEDGSMEAARQELDAVALRVVREDPEGTFPNATVLPIRAHIYGPEMEQGGRVMAAAVLFVLLIACANIANILLARGLGRSHEIAIRAAVGAGRGRIVQRLLVESVLIALVGGVAGIGVAHVGLDLLLTYALPPDLPGWNEMAIDRRMLGVAGALTLASTLVFGLFPALRAARVDLRGRLAEGGRDGGSGRLGRSGSALVVGEISASLVLVVLSGLMIRAIVEMRGVDLGMRLDDAVVFRLDVAEASQATSPDLRLFHESLMERLAAEPGITAVTASSGHFLSQWSTVLYSVPGLTSLDDRDQRSAEFRRVAWSYADMLGLEVVAGRWFDAGTDPDGGEATAVVSSELARLWWSNPADAVGERLARTGGPTYEIVGVVEGGRIRGPQRAPPPILFEPLARTPARYTFWMVRHASDPGAVVGRVREVVRELDPNLALFNVQTGEEMFEEMLAPQQAGLRILATLGLLALLLTLVGVYGVVAHSVGQRMREMGLRMALGASRGGVVRLVVGSSAKTAAIGLAIGVLLSLGAGQGLAFLLASVSPRDPVVLTSAAVLLFAAVILASLVPATRAAGADPVRTLRGD